MRHLLILAVTLLFTGTSKAQVTPNASPASGTYNAGNVHSDSSKNKYLGQSYPAFDFITTTGAHISSQNCKGKVVYINCWFEYCHPCQAEFGALNEIYKKLSKDTSFIMIALAKEPMERLPDLLKKYGLDYPSASELGDAYKYNLNNGFPTSIVLDAAGNIAYLTAGGPTDKDKAREKVMTKIYPAIQVQLANVHSR